MQGETEAQEIARLEARADRLEGLVSRHIPVTGDAAILLTELYKCHAVIGQLNARITTQCLEIAALTRRLVAQHALFMEANGYDRQTCVVCGGPLDPLVPGSWCPRCDARPAPGPRRRPCGMIPV